VKLYELVGIKKFADLDFKEVLATMHEYDAAGKGANAIVIKHGARNEVIKFWLEDAAYEDFINYVDKNPSEYFPKLYSKPKELTAFFLRPKDFPKKVKYVRMEELEAFKEPFSGFVDMLRDVIYLAGQTKTFDEFTKKRPKYDSLDRWSKFDKEFIKVIFNFVREIDSRVSHSFLSSNKHFFDIHAGNIMMRGTTPVIIDPIANNTSMDLTDPIIRGLENAKKLPDHAVSKGRSK
jgi:hypothetical protein